MNAPDNQSSNPWAVPAPNAPDDASLRAYLAAHALAGMLANPSNTRLYPAVAADAVLCADAALAALKGGENASS